MVEQHRSATCTNGCSRAGLPSAEPLTIAQFRPPGLDWPDRTGGLDLSNYIQGFARQEEISPDTFTANQIHCRVYQVIREATERFAERSGWKRSVPWLVSSLGAALNVGHAYVYKNYPDKDGVLTGVRLFRWSNPLHRSAGGLSDPRVSRYEGEYLGYLLGELSERRSVLCTIRNPLPPLVDYMEANGVDRIVTVPIFAGDDWWGFMGVEDAPVVPARAAEVIPITAINDILRTAAAAVGESIRGAGLDQALRWSERLQRAQRDIALTVTRGSDRRNALNKLLTLICELGEFDAGAIDMDAIDGTRIAEVGVPPSDERWCESCRPSFANAGGSPDPVFGDSTMLEFCSHGCPVRSAGFHSYAAVPIVHEGTPAAVLSLFSARRSIVPAAVRRSISAIAAEIGMIIAIVRSEERQFADRANGERPG